MRILLPALLLAATTALILPPPRSEAFSFIGGSLSLSQRDVRVFNNFADASANDNTAPESNYPGYDGAERAIWKAIVEWGSELHGTGFGDPTQPGGIGSGGANFDPSWQGNANGVGTSNQNIHSAESGGDGGTLAYCETPISDGWRIRYLESWTWHDGPLSEPSGIDLQGIACHEYGHALGLGHSSDTNATMFPTAGGTGSGQRDLGTDDINGIRALYGVKASSKPRILSTSLAGSTLTINGSSFTTTGNEVWFTQAASGGTGEPVKVTGLASTLGGTRITVNVPATAGAGDVLVKESGSGNSTLSNAFPFDPTGAPAVLPQITGSVPAQVPAVALGGNSVVLEGSRLEGAISLTVGGIAVSFQVLDDQHIAFEMPLVGALGAQPIALTTYLGSTTGSLQVVAPADPVFAVSPGAVLNGQSITTLLGSSPADFAFVFASFGGGASELPGLISLDIGDGFANLVQIASYGVPAKAWTQQVYPIVGLPAQATIYLQAALLRAANPVLPLVESNRVEFFVVF
jgi:hypothetical protein